MATLECMFKIHSRARSRLPKNESERRLSEERQKNVSTWECYVKKRWLAGGWWKPKRKTGKRIKPSSSSIYFAVRNLHILWAWNELIYSLSQGAFKSVHVERRNVFDFYLCEEILSALMLRRSRETTTKNVRRMTAITKARANCKTEAINNDIYQYVGLIIQLITIW